MRIRGGCSYYRKMHWDLGHFFAALMGGLRRALRQPYSHALPPPPPPRRRRLRPEVNFLGFPRAIDFQTAEPGSGLEGLKNRFRGATVDLAR